MPLLLSKLGSLVPRLNFLGVSFLDCKTGITKFTLLGPKVYITSKYLRQCGSHSRLVTDFFFIVSFLPAQPGATARLGWPGKVEAFPSRSRFTHPPSTAAPTLTLPICCLRCCTPIRSISQPGGSGYRRLNDKVPPLPARPASSLAAVALWFQHSLAEVQEEARTSAERRVRL